MSTLSNRALAEIERLERTIAGLRAENADLRRRLDGVRSFIVEEDPHGRTTEDDRGQW